MRLRDSRFALAFITLLTPLCLVIHGFHPYAEDGGLYAAGIKLILHPALYPHSLAFVEAHLRFSLFAPAMAALVRTSHLSLSSLLLAVYLAGIWATLNAVWLLAKRCYPSRVEHAGAVALTAAWLTIPVAGTSLILVDPYVTARSISLPCTLFALVCTIDLMRATRFTQRLRGTLCCSGFLLVAMLAHPLMAAYALGDVLLLAFALSSRRAIKILGMAALSGIAIALAGILYAVAHPEIPGYAEIAATRFYWFLSRWHWYEGVGLAAPIMILAAVAFIRQNSSAASQDEAVRQALSKMALVSGATAVLVSVAFAHEPSSTYLVARLQPLRTFQTVYVVMIIVLGATLAQRVLQRKAWRWIATFLLLGGIMIFVQCSTFPASAHIEWPGSQPANRWTQAFRWIRNNTPEDALFALDADYISMPGEDAQCFRAIAERSALPDFSKDGGEASINPALTGEWHVGQTAQRRLSQENDTMRRIALQPTGVNWIVLQAYAQTGFVCPYTNEAVKVCRLP